MFAPEESLAFLRNSLDKRKDKDEDLKILAERLGHLPLALELASRYLNGHPRLSINEYLVQAREAFEHPSMRDWRKDLPAPTQHDLDLQRTFALSWEALKDENAQKIFQTAGYLAPNTPIPPEIFEKALEISSEICDEVLSTLYGLGLLRQSENEQPTIHPLLAEYARGINQISVNSDLIEKLSDQLSILARKANDQVDQTGSLQWFAPLRSHILSTVDFADKAEIEDAANLLGNLGYYLQKIADYSGARTAFERALKIHEAAFGPDHPNVAIRVNNLGLVLKDLGDLSGARTAYERALKIFKQFLPADHPSIKIVQGNLDSLK
ncbi:MAG: tetratricopeptide repeat protein [Chloroflexota bacterium]|nr:tetratricopeptide repeat protein [Chloroflexota bacterium]